MRRQIEELSRQQAEQQKKLLTELRNLFCRRIFFFNPPKDIDRFCEELVKYIEISDRLWDTLAANHSTMVFKSLQWRIEKLTAEYAHLKLLLQTFIHLEDSLKLLIASIREKISSEDLRRLEEFRQKLEVIRYENFEERFRGSRQKISEHLKFYLPFFSGKRKVLDIGCGRGEFLALLKAEGIEAEGVDLSFSMLQQAQENGLQVYQEDALQFLQRTPEKKYDAIFSSQFIEHIDFEQLKALLRHCRRVLRRDGLIILETLNPLSLFALSRIFFLDPTHRTPLHPEFMRFLLEVSGFSEVEIIYRSLPEKERLEEFPQELEAAAIQNRNVDRLNDLLFSHIEYAVKGIVR